MYGMNFSGGDNRTHGQVERAERIDSFEAGKVEGWGILFSSSMVPLDCEHFMEDDREIVELSRGQWFTTLELTRTPSGFGGSCVFWLCPRCGKRVRFLYFKGRGFLCRGCAKLNYRSQQATRSDSMYFYHKGCDLVEKHLDTWPRVRPDGFSFCAWVPERPRYMHQTTYRRYLRRFAKYQHHHQKRQMEDMARLLRIFK